MATEEKTVKTKGMDAKAMIAENSEKRTKIRYADRLECEVIRDTKYLKKGKIINPHPVMAEQLIKDGIVKKVTK